MPTSRISAHLLAGLSPGLAQGATAAGTGGSAFQQGYGQAQTLQSRLAQALSTVRINNAKADGMDREAAMQSPDAVLANALTANNVPQDAAPEVSQYLKTGSAGAQYDPLPADQAGPVAPPPNWMAKANGITQALAATQTALALGDKNSGNVAKAIGLARDRQLSDDVISGQADPTRVAQGQYAVKGNAPYHFAEFGVGNNLTGQVDASGAPAQNFAANRQAETVQHRAAAGASAAAASNSYASAEQHRAGTEKTRQDISMGAKGQYDPATGMLIDTRNGTARAITGPDGQPIGARPKELTEGQAKDNAYGSRMQEANGILTGLQGKYSPAAVNARVAVGDVPGVGMVGNWMQSAEGQQVEQAQRDFINAILRRESGAAIAPSEFANAAKQYFPQPNDKPENLAQKARNRQIAIEGVYGSVPIGKRGVPSLSNPAGQPAPGAVRKFNPETGRIE